MEQIETCKQLKCDLLLEYSEGFDRFQTAQLKSSKFLLEFETS